MGYADQINDHRFPVKDSDPGSVERNQLHHSVALQRASAETVASMSHPRRLRLRCRRHGPSRAVDVPVRSRRRRARRSEFNEEKMREVKKEHAVESGDSHVLGQRRGNRNDGQHGVSNPRQRWLRWRLIHSRAARQAHSPINSRVRFGLM